MGGAGTSCGGPNRKTKFRRTAAEKRINCQNAASLLYEALEGIRSQSGKCDAH